MKLLVTFVCIVGVGGLLPGALAGAAPRDQSPRPGADRPGGGQQGGGEGFVREAPPPPSSRKIRRLTDDPGLGEKVPRGRVEAIFGLTGAESIPTHPGVAVGLTALARPVGDFWLGGGVEYRALTGEGRYESMSDWSVFAQARYYFMPHPEANRFVMGYLLLQVGYARLAASGAESVTRSQGLDLGLGVGVGAALSPRVYLGIQFKFRFPVWVDSCLEISGSKACTDRPGDFQVTTWQFSLVVSRSF